jgi:hypothetical protein
MGILPMEVILDCCVLYQNEITGGELVVLDFCWVLERKAMHIL